MAGNHLFSIWISSPDSYSERRFSPHLTVAELKCKLQPITGISVTSQMLELNILTGHPDHRNSTFLEVDERTLLEYGVQDGATIYVSDTNPGAASQAGQYNDVSQVEKYELPEEEYQKRPDSLLAFKMRHKLGRFNHSIPLEQDPPQPAQVDLDKLLQKYPVGCRCEVQINKSGTFSDPLGMKIRGTLRFVGPVEFNKKFPFWIGIELDEPSGKNNGSVDGHEYFKCPLARGIFVQPDRIEVGDFPPIDPLENEEF